LKAIEQRYRNPTLGEARVPVNIHAATAFSLNKIPFSGCVCIECARVALACGTLHGVKRAPQGKLARLPCKGKLSSRQLRLMSRKLRPYHRAILNGDKRGMTFGGIKKVRG
jgi:hypothetical protein